MMGSYSVLKQLKKLVLHNLERRVPETEASRLATLLDPGLKGFVDMSLRKGTTLGSDAH
jgi:hypothetical protein